MKVIAFAGALRSESVCKKLVQEAVRFIQERYGLRSEYIDLKEYPFPLYDSDIEQAIGIPDGITRLGKHIASSNAIIVASPEYNGGISSVLKTLIDWLSRLNPNPLAGKFLLLLSASPSGSGGMQGLWHTRVPFEALGVHVFPNMVAIARAETLFNEKGRLKDEKASQKLNTALVDFIDHVGKHFPIRRTPDADRQAM